MGKFHDTLIERSLSLKSKVDGASPAIVLLTEGDDPRMLEAAGILAAKGLARVKLIFSSKEPTLQLAKGIEPIVVADENELRESFSQQLFEHRSAKGMTLEQAKQLLNDPLYFGALYLFSGYADAAVSGARNTTASVIKAGMYGIGLRPEVKTISSIFLMLLKDGRTISYADCGVVPYPDAEQLADIAISAARSHELLCQEEPYVALLSFSTLGSSQHPQIELLRTALKRIKDRAPSLKVDGELQFDAAFVPEVADRKAMNSPVAGRANVFIFPNLDAGNIAYKITERIGGAQALGPILQGLSLPWMDLSRGCSADDIALVALVGLLMREN